MHLSHLFLEFLENNKDNIIISVLKSERNNWHITPQGPDSYGIRGFPYNNYHDKGGISNLISTCKQHNIQHVYWLSQRLFIEKPSKNFAIIYKAIYGEKEKTAGFHDEDEFESEDIYNFRFHADSEIVEPSTAFVAEGDAGVNYNLLTPKIAKYLKDFHTNNLNFINKELAK